MNYDDARGLRNQLDEIDYKIHKIAAKQRTVAKLIIIGLVSMAFWSLNSPIMRDMTGQDRLWAAAGLIGAGIYVWTTYRAAFKKQDLDRKSS